MKKHLLLFLLTLFAGYCFSQKDGIALSSTDTTLQTAFYQAKAMALSYKGKPGDPVGPWYESALPPRSAFCMRDVSHQTIAAEILGLSAANKNMLTLFAKNISQSKDWCSYWEMNKHGKPAPEDYRNDTAFWYNLNANFDVLNACWKLYLWTGDKTYIIDAAFKNFYDRSVNEFIRSWVLQPDSLLTRPAHPNAPAHYNEKVAFNRCRGLPSYSEGVPDIKMGIDLVAALYRGLLSYAAIAEAAGNKKMSDAFIEKAKQYQQHIDRYWWDEQAQRYNTFYSNKDSFGKNEGETFLLWFDAIKDSARKQKTLEHLVSGDWNVENLSYFPLIMYQNGYAEKGYDYILHLTSPSTKRREYPEVSFGVIKGIVEGLMGVEADARYNRISTLYRHLSSSTTTVKDIPVLNSLISVTHYGAGSSMLQNKGKKAIIWRAKFYSRIPYLYYQKKQLKTRQETDWKGQVISFADVVVQPGQQAMVTMGMNNQ